MMTPQKDDYIKIVLAIIITLALAILVNEINAEPIGVGPQHVLKWESTGLDVKGNPEHLRKFVFGLRPADNPQAPILEAYEHVFIQNEPLNATHQLPVVDLLRDHPNLEGAQDVMVKAVDWVGLESTWTPPLTIVWDDSIPQLPGGFRVEIKIIVVAKP